MVGTKAFAVSIVLMPVLMFGSIMAMKFLQNTGEIQQRTIVVVDNHGGFLSALRWSAAMNNSAVTSQAEDSESPGKKFSLSKGATYTIESQTGPLSDDARAELSQKVRLGEIYAFAEIPEDVHLLESADAAPTVDFYSEDSGVSDGRRWFANIINDRVLAVRLQAVGIDYSRVALAKSPVRVRGLGLVEKTEDGSVSAAKEKDELSAIFVPMTAMMLMFMVTFLASQPMLESVLEEKSQRIAEVLLGSANPSQLMAGKLIGTVGGSLTVFAIYAIGGYFVAQNQGMAESIPFHIVPWFVVFQLWGVMFYASIFMAVGATVSQLKEAQSLLLPVWMMMMVPMFVWIFVVREPNGSMATGLSLFPPATPAMMVLRMATGATIPIWQPVVGLFLLALATAFVVFLAGRIFRVGILWQGKTPKLTELARWALAG